MPIRSRCGRAAGVRRTRAGLSWHAATARSWGLAPILWHCRATLAVAAVPYYRSYCRAPADEGEAGDAN